MFIDQLKKENTSLKKLIANLENQKNEDLGKLHVSSRGKYCELYHIPPNSQKRNYLSKENLGLAKIIAQQEYNDCILVKAKQIQKKLSSFINFYEKNDMEDVYKKLGAGRKELVKPYALSYSDYVNNWLNTEYEKLKTVPGEILTKNSRGESMRSKSEYIISEMLIELDIPYKHDFPIRLSDNSIRYVDFALLNKRTLETKYMEHFGLTSNPNYVNSMLHKIEEYSKVGLILGKNFFFTYETEGTALNTEMIRQVIIANCC